VTVGSEFGFQASVTVAALAPVSDMPRVTATKRAERAFSNMWRIYVDKARVMPQFGSATSSNLPFLGGYLANNEGLHLAFF
jgi:hypothetical protein